MDIRLAVLTSGGDAPGMNAAVRAVVRYANKKKWAVFGFREGYKGLCDEDNNYMERLEAKDVSHILGRGGTFLRSARFPEFKESEDIRIEALKNLGSEGINSLVVIGGDGSFKGASVLFENNKNAGEYHIEDFRIVCIPATIDNDIPYTKYSIGADTALNTAMECIDKVRDTAYSHSRIFIIQVMGRNCDYLPVMTGISVGANIILGPQDKADISTIKMQAEKALRGRKDFFIIVVAEGLTDIKSVSKEEVDTVNSDDGKYTVAQRLSEKIDEALSEEFRGDVVRPVVLGHVQRGGNPSVRDRILATRMGVAAVDALSVNNRTRQKEPVMVALKNDGDIGGKIDLVLLEEVLKELEKGPPTVDKVTRSLNEQVVREI